MASRVIRFLSKLLDFSGTPTNGQVPTWNTGASKWEPQTPAAAPVTSVAGKTGAVTLANTDIEGLGTAATYSAGAFDPSGAATAAQSSAETYAAGVASAAQSAAISAAETASLQKSANLSDLASAATARTSLGLGSAAVANTGTASGDVPVLGSGGLLTNPGGISSPASGSLCEQFGAGATAAATTGYNTAVGANADASSYGGSTAVGFGATADAYQSTALGQGATANAGGAMALGQGCTASASYAIAIGYEVTNSVANSLSIGSATLRTGPSVQIGTAHPIGGGAFTNLTGINFAGNFLFGNGGGGTGGANFYTDGGSLLLTGGAIASCSLFQGDGLQITGALADGTYPLAGGLGSLTITNGVPTAVS